MSKFKGAQNSAILAIMPTDYWSIPADSAAASASTGTLTLSGNTTITAAQTALYTVYTTTDINITYNLISSGTGTYNFSHATFALNIHFIDSSGDVDVFGPKNGGWLEGSGSDTVTGGAGNDTVYVAASDVAPGLILNGGLGENVLELADGADISRLKTLPKDFQTLQLNGSATVTGAESSLFTSVVDQDDNITFDLYASAAGTYNFSQAMFSPNVHFHGLTGSNKILGPKNGGWIEGSDNDTVTGGAGNDTVYVSATDVAAGLVLNGGAGQNLLELADGANLSKLDAAPADFYILQLDGSATISAAQSGVFPMITDQDGNVTFNLFASGAGTYNFSKESFASNVHFHGFAGSDLILAPESGGWIEGSGNDTVTGGAGNDTVYVAPADVSSGLILNGGGGQNLLEAANGTNLSELKTLPSQFDVLQVDGSATISPSESTLFTFITIPDDNLTYALQGSTAGTYDFGNSTVAPNVQFFAGAGDEVITAAGHNYIAAGVGNDTLIAMNAGGATLVAGTANDVFQLDEFAANNDVIQGFKGAGIAGGDILDLHGFGTGATLIYNGGTSYTVNYSSGSETFTVQTADGHQLTAGDYTFK